MNRPKFSVIPIVFNEEKNIEKIIKSVYEQNYRSLELVIVDGGSKDKTFSIAKKMQKKLKGKDFTMKVLDERESGNKCSPANARNYGVDNATGEYVIFIHGDTFLTRKDFLEKLAGGLKDNYVVWNKFKVIEDTWFEHQLVLDHGSKDLLGPAFRREVFKKVRFDPSIGTGDDNVDLPEQLKKYKFLGKKLAIVDVETRQHEPHSLREFTIQRWWHGRTVWPLIKKYPHTFMGMFAIPSGPIGLLVLGLILLFFNKFLALIFFVPLLAYALWMFIKSKEKNLSRLWWCSTLFLWASLIRVLSMINGLFQYMRGQMNLRQEGPMGTKKR